MGLAAISETGPITTCKTSEVVHAVTPREPPGTVAYSTVQSRRSAWCCRCTVSRLQCLAVARTPQLKPVKVQGPGSKRVPRAASLPTIVAGLYV